LALETIDINGSESIYSLATKLDLNKVLPSKVSIWKLRCKNPMRKSFSNRNIRMEEFDALIRLTSEMSKYLYPYIREILSSCDNYKISPELWNGFQNRFIELIEERFNKESIIVKNLINSKSNQNFYRDILMSLALCISEDGISRLKMTLLNL